MVIRFASVLDCTANETVGGFLEYVSNSCNLPVRPGGDSLAMIRVTLPTHLRSLAHIDGEVQLEVAGEVTQRSVLNALEARYPVLRGAIREHDTLKRRAFIRFFACEEDLSHESPDAPLPEAVANGKEPLMIVGAIAGG
jgi:sulfur-carrier protein